MRLARLDLLRYGKFTDRSLYFPRQAHDFCMIVGPNEAGKSTVRRAIRELLFGMPKRSSLDFIHPLRELRLGGVVEGPAGTVEFDRTRKRESLRTRTDQCLSDELLKPYLGELTVEHFDRLCCLDHQQLLNGGQAILSAADDYGRLLLQAASGIDGLEKIQNGLDVRMTELWAPKAQKNEFMQAQRLLTEATEAKRSASVRAKQWEEVQQTRDSLDQQIEELKQRLRTQEILLGRMERVRRVSPMLGQLRDVEQQLQALREVKELPAHAAQELARGREALSVSVAMHKDKTEQLQARQQYRAEIRTDDQILELAEEIAPLAVLCGKCVTHEREIRVIEAELRALLEQVRQDARELGWPEDEAALRRQVPSEIALATLGDLLQQHAALERDAVNATERLQQAEQSVADNMRLLASVRLVEVSTELYAALESARELRNAAALSERLQARISAEESALDQRLLALGRWQRPVAELQRMLLPARERVEQWARQHNELQGELRLVQQRQQEVEAEYNALTLQVAQFLRGHRIVTAAEVQEARAQRDSHWIEIKTERVALHTGSPVLDAAIRLADELVDARLANAEDSAGLQALREQLEQAEQKRDNLRSMLDRLQRQLAAQREEWNRLLESADLSGLEYLDYSEWTEKRQEVLLAAASLQELRAERAETQAALTRVVAALRAELTGLDAIEAGSLGLAELVKTAQSLIGESEQSLTRKQELERQTAQQQAAISQFRAARERAQQALSAWKVEWDRALQTLNLCNGAGTIVEVNAAMTIVRRVKQSMQDLHAKTAHKLNPRKADLAELELQLTRLCTRLGLEKTEDSDLLLAAGAIVQRLQQAQAQQERAREADAAILQAMAQLEEADRQIQLAYAKLQPWFDLAGSDDLATVLQIAEASDRRRELLTKQSDLQQKLIELGDGMARTAIEQEVNELNRDDLPAQIEDLRRALKELRDAKDALQEPRLAAQQALAAISGNATAALAEAQRQEALAAMAQASEEYLELCVTSRLLRWLIERYKEQHQAPLLAAANAIFCEFTLGRFDKLAVDHEQDPPTLIARRSDGSTVEVAGLSEGTRDQLFLALRLAAIQLRTAQAQPLPFVADDLFVNFDDERSAAGLRTLYSLSQHMQVLFLTHHDHLEELAKNTLGDTFPALRLDA